MAPPTIRWAEPRSGARNIISGNHEYGVFILNSGTINNLVQGNYIGLAAGGVAALGNDSAGVFIADSAANNLIGGTVAGAGNAIAFNGGDGVLIGSNASYNALAGDHNSVLGNHIFSNAGQGIDLGPDDGAAPSPLINTPTLSSAFVDGASLYITGFITTQTGLNFRIEFFDNITGNQGRTFLGFANVTIVSDITLIFSTTLTVPATVLSGHKLTTTMTDELGNTSEFSIPLTIE